jgi:hypothetical protein
MSGYLVLISSTRAFTDASSSAVIKKDRSWVVNLVLSFLLVLLRSD